MNTPMPPDLTLLSLPELTRLAHATHVSSGQPGHAAEVQFDVCRHHACVRMREELDRRQQP